MIGQLTVMKATYRHFKEACYKAGIEFRCIGEGVDGDRYEVQFDEISDIYAVGQYVGMSAITQQGFSESELTQL